MSSGGVALIIYNLPYQLHKLWIVGMLTICTLRSYPKCVIGANLKFFRWHNIHYLFRGILATIFSASSTVYT